MRTVHIDSQHSDVTFMRVVFIRCVTSSATNPDEDYLTHTSMQVSLADIDTRIRTIERRRGQEGVRAVPLSLRHAWRQLPVRPRTCVRRMWRAACNVVRDPNEHAGHRDSLKGFVEASGQSELLTRLAPPHDRNDNRCGAL
jgi:hypothetical protein